MQVTYRSILAGVGRSVSSSILETSSKRPNVIPYTLSISRGIASKKWSWYIERRASSRPGIYYGRPNLRRKPIPPFEYGGYEEPDPIMMTSCPSQYEMKCKGMQCADLPMFTPEYCS
nr:uncharacterized protein LOC106689461 [Halyomorpha halys]